MSEPQAKVRALTPEVTRDPSLLQLEAFSNGVFAFAVTLLALGLVVPHLTGSVGAGRLASELGGEWPRFLSSIVCEEVGPKSTCPRVRARETVDRRSVRA